jgi:hypothetical protein
MPSTAIRRYSFRKLLPWKDACETDVENFSMAPSATLAAGLIVGVVTATANDAQVITITGTPTGGTFTLSGTNPLNGAAFTTAAIAYNAAASAVASAVQAALGYGTITGSGGALPGAAVTVTASGTLAATPIPLMTGNIAGLTGGTPALAVTRGTVGRRANTLAAYASGNSDGTQNPVGALVYDYASDANGLIYKGSAAQAEYDLAGEPYAGVYVGGTFLVADLTGLDATAVTRLGGHYLGPNVVVWPG